jgi:hypothetical protein
MNINDMYQICQYAINKAQNGYLTPSQFNLLANQAQVSYMDYLLGEFQQYQIGRPQSRVNYSQNSDTRQRIAPFIKNAVLTTDADGLALYPNDYLQTDSVRTSTNERLRFVQPDSLYSYLRSEIDPIVSNPIYLIQDLGYKIYPNTTDNGVTLTNLKLSYVMNPPSMQWGYCLDSNGRPVYNPTAPPQTTTTTTLANCTFSIQPLWYDIDKLEIIARILKLVGVSLQTGQVEQYANMVTTQGQ